MFAKFYCRSLSFTKKFVVTAKVSSIFINMMKIWIKVKENLNKRQKWSNHFAMLPIKKINTEWIESHFF